MNEDIWRVAKKGKQNLACLVNGHSCCNSECGEDPCYKNPNTIGHCFLCGTVIKLSSNKNLSRAWPNLDGDTYVFRD